jgi:hypothetical protein
MNPENSFPVKLWKRIKRVSGSISGKRDKFLAGFDFDQSEFPNLRVVAREILESASETECAGDRRSQCHSS